MKIVEYGKQHRDVVMLLHGGGLSWWNYKSEAELLCDRYHVVLPILDGHAESDEAFVSIEHNADRIISFINMEFGGSVFLIGGLSLGAQILLEILSKRTDICRYAVIESASVIPSPMTNALIEPAVSCSYHLIQKKWFAKMQFRSLHIRDDLFEAYYRDTSKISKASMIAFLKANTAYEPKAELKKCAARTRIVVGGKEQKKLLQSAELLHQLMPQSLLEIKKRMYHGEYSVNHPEQYVKDLLENAGQ
ncbi:MAG: alpha/beta hydrolase [Clostridia bacterium]|nr:alpha/beta hydrolase [Clostridia bacterium]